MSSLSWQSEDEERGRGGANEEDVGGEVPCVKRLKMLRRQEMSLLNVAEEVEEEKDEEAVAESMFVLFIHNICTKGHKQIHTQEC